MKFVIAVILVVVTCSILDTLGSELDEMEKRFGKCEAEGKFPVKYNCRRYTHCVKKFGRLIPIPRKCSYFKHFDSEAQSCEKGHCHGPSPTSTPVPPTNPPQTETPSTNPPQTEAPPTNGPTETPEPSTLPPVTSTENSTQETNEPAPTTANPGCTVPGYFVNPENCSKFYRCYYSGDNLVRIDYVCPSELIFCQSKLSCDYVDSCENNPCYSEVL